MDYTVHGILQARILEWIAFPFSRGSSQCRDWAQVSCIAGRFFTSWATREIWFKSQNLKVVFFSIPSLPFPLIPASNNFICDWLLLLCFFFFYQKSVRVRVCFAILSYTGGSLLYILFCAFVRHTENNCTLVYRTLFWKNLYFYFLKESGLFINLFFNYFGHAVRLVGCEFSDQRLNPGP